MLKLNTCILGIQSDFPGLIVGTSPPLLERGVQEHIPQPILDKLKPQNNTGLGSASGQGNLLNTRASTMPILYVVNNWLTNKLAADELALILRNRSRFSFTIGVGDRRASLKVGSELPRTGTLKMLTTSCWHQTRGTIRATTSG
ncbi:hypothetical protein CDJ04_25425 [Salmonella enterica]|uniref:Uncharacterized protein n=1 Tax=Salmonella enterica I TaxID=59201 RepID=A0A403QQJ4_SALET|nr:hypothetical protein [Salmonella enterica]EBQ9005224.1 hypothetical protein [Salmonella enterica subsp. enterica serovar Blockley]EBS0797424.1 hypothetical protein [Salmonella enterica subsp. enterica serovar Overschie]EBZ5140002.1 hypothetical protein [Salmonella enterica subsp. enterica serovar Antsalova]ECE6544675.1 hypothetical protein [Salmonella enterica subsp. enterica]ECU7995247.1 hypothetical protein [Salmonella enterica subsp. enterica serovar Toucra]MML56947.1 hypothetical prote